MKLIALRSFRNQKRAIKIADPIHPDHIHKGAIFDIGSKPDFEDLNPEEQQLVKELNAAHAIGDADNAKLVARIKAEVADEKRVDDRAAASAKAAAGAPASTDKK